MLHCVLTTQSQIIFRHLGFDPSLPHPLRFGNRHTVVCVCVFVCFSFVRAFVEKLHIEMEFAELITLKETNAH